MFHVDHIVPRSRGGITALENLALQCPYCSLHKSDKINAYDVTTQPEVALFHPLTQVWAEHFAISADGSCLGLTAVGRVTSESLHMNGPLPKTARALQLQFGLL